MIKLDASSPVPLYHQLSEALRYRIATGSIAAGETLPSLRNGAELWGVHLHTVRRAYVELAKEGLVRMSPAEGTVVLGSANGRPRPSGVDDFLARMIHEAERQFGLSPLELRKRLVEYGAPGRQEVPAVNVIECTDVQATELARQLEGAWQVKALGWSLQRAGEPPAGPMIATYFHYQEIRKRWAQRRDEIRFARLSLDPFLGSRFPDAGPGQGRIDLLLCEREWGIATNMATDVLTVLGSSRYNLELFVSDSPEAALAAPEAEGKLVLFSPRMWGELPPAEQADRRAVELRYFFEPDDLLAIAEEFSWRSRPSKSSRS